MKDSTTRCPECGGPPQEGNPRKSTGKLDRYIFQCGTVATELNDQFDITHYGKTCQESRAQQRDQTKKAHILVDAVPAGFTPEQYQEVIRRIELAQTQLEPDGKTCAICGDSGHQAFECHRNPLVALRLYPMFRFFHCGEIFTADQAPPHFGTSESELAACIRQQFGAFHPPVAMPNRGKLPFLLEEKFRAYLTFLIARLRFDAFPHNHDMSDSKFAQLITDLSRVLQRIKSDLLSKS